MLLPSAGSMAVYNASDEVLWCSDGYERPDLRGLLDRLRVAGSSTLAGRGNVEQTADGVPALVATLRAAPMLVPWALSWWSRPRLAATPSMVVSMLRPVLDCLESHMDDIARVARPIERQDAGSIDLLLSVDEDDREDASALHQLLRHCVQHLGCVMGALLVPDKNLTVTCALDASLGGSQLLDRTQKHLLAWAQLNNRPMVVNRVGIAADVAPYKILSCPVRDLHGRVMGLTALFRAATAEDFELRDIRILEFVSRKAVSILNSQHDALTGLVNRLIFERRVQTLLDSASGEGHALLYIDIDKLESINQAFGFHAGDEVTQRVGDVIRRVAGPAATASRIGGDRFAVLLPERDVAAAGEVGKRILSATAQLGYVSGVDTVPVTVSIGVAAAGQPHERVAHLLAAAELACKRAKQQGRNRVGSDDASQALPANGQGRSLAAANLQEALKSNEFCLEAQPIVGLAARAGDTVGYELLVRMRNAAGELLAPDKFLDAAERYELLPALDRWVLCSAIDVLRAHAEQLAAVPYCFTINVSAQSLANRKYAEFALEQLAQARLPPAAFCFEVKEAAAVNHIAAAEIFIRDLTSAGCKIALDDFGCGLSSLAHLKRLPVHYLKIDGRFVRRIADDRIAESIVSGIARAARTLDVSTIAEHVESVAMADKLRELDVDFGQGFYFGHPQPFVGLAEGFGRRPAARLTTRL
jgi:diguanylate cyclase (GGDEF)-like protein